MNILIGSDHAGYLLKEKIKEYLTQYNNYNVIDVGCFNQKYFFKKKVKQKIYYMMLVY
jgi:ribose 5-phosphate isomerase RpiB